MPDGWRMTSGGGDREDGRHGPELVRIDMNPELEAFIPLFPPADLTDPAAARKNLGIHAGTFHGPGDQTRKEHQASGTGHMTTSGHIDRSVTTIGTSDRLATEKAELERLRGTI
jgi:hypothetical protein